MSRLKRFADSLISGYALILVNIIYTLASVPLALHYLSEEEFGLWVLVTQVCNFNTLLVDFGMSGALARILIDHKDDARSTKYGTVIQTGLLVLAVQGVIIAGVGILVSYWLPHWMDVPEKNWRVFRLLVSWQCVMLAISFGLRIFPFMLQAHQRYDVCNYANLVSFATSLAGMWAGFAAGLGLYSLLLGGAVTFVVSGVLTAWQTWRLGFFPARGRWGQPNRATFKELFFYGTDMFLITIGLQLITASQAMVITRTLGLEAVAVWSIATKLFMLSQQAVYRLLDYSTAAFSEMMVRGEKDRLRARFRDLVMLSGALSAAVGVTMALCNHAFLQIWTQNRIAWPDGNDLLMAFSLVIYASTRCHIALACMTKKIGNLKFIYFVEGLAFVGLGSWLAPRWGLSGIIFSGILTNLIFSGIYGVWRSGKYFSVRVAEMVIQWLRPPVLVFLMVLGVSLGLRKITTSLAAPLELLICGLVGGAFAAFSLWQFGLPPHLRQEVRQRLRKFRGR